MPGSPASRTNWRRPARAASQAASSRASSAVRPTKVERSPVRAAAARGSGRLGRVLPDDLAGGDGLGEALERQPAEGPERAAVPVADEALDERRGQDLAAPGPAAEPLGDDHRRAEEVVVLADGLAGVEPDPNRQGLGPPLRLSSATACWISTAQRRAASGLAKAAISPSPRLFTSVPPWASSACAERRRSGRRRSSSAASSPSRSSSSVEPTRSVNMKVTTPAAAGAVGLAAPGRGRPVERRDRGAGSAVPGARSSSPGSMPSSSPRWRRRSW